MIFGKSLNNENIIYESPNNGKVTKFLCQKVDRIKKSNKLNFDTKQEHNESFPSISEVTHSNSNLNIVEKCEEPINHIKYACNCKNSQCLKLYCECFSNLQYCDPNICSCKGCFNNTENNSLRNEKINTYIKKKITSFKHVFDVMNENGNEKGCTCKKSNCLKKYCECYQKNFKCGTSCKCVECKNIKVSQSSNTSTRTSSFSNYYESKLNLNKKLVPCLVIINNYKINEEYVESGYFDY